MILKLCQELYKMEKEQNIIKFLNTIDKRGVKQIISVDFKNISNRYTEYFDFWYEIEYLPNDSNRTTIISLSKFETDDLNIYLNTDLKVLNYLEENDLTIQEIKNYLEEINGCKIYKFHSFDIGKNDLIVRYFDNDYEKMPKYRTVVKNHHPKVSLKDSCEIVFDALKNDVDYYYSWQANIAMAFLDTKRWFLEEYGLEEVPKEMELALANRAAKYFLNTLIDDKTC